MQLSNARTHAAIFWRNLSQPVRKHKKEECAECNVTRCHSTDFQELNENGPERIPPMKSGRTRPDTRRKRNGRSRVYFTQSVLEAGLLCSRREASRTQRAAALHPTSEEASATSSGNRRLPGVPLNSVVKIKGEKELLALEAEEEKCRKHSEVAEGSAMGSWRLSSQRMVPRTRDVGKNA